MADFNARSVEFKGSLVVLGPIETVFDLFSPLGERPWVPDWAYAFIGLTPEGNAAIAAMTESSYVEKMKRWERWIGQYLARRGQSGAVTARPPTRVPERWPRSPW